jgi:poly(A) polymerase
MQPLIIPRSGHPISRRDIDPDALKVLYRLYRAGHQAYLVGGGVRDLLLGAKPKDFDISTDAHPQKIRKLFRNCVLVGRRFRLAHVRFGDHVVEVSTFRKAPEEGGPEPAAPGALLIRQDNTFGTPEDDALRRDFTINALFYDIGTYSIIDYVGGLRDLEDGCVRSIGAADIRYQEDPVRMIRAVKFAARLGFEITDDDQGAIDRHRRLLRLASIPRLLEEILKLLRGGASAATFKLLAETRLLHELLPGVSAHLERTSAMEDPESAPFFRYLFALDDAIAAAPGETPTASFLLGCVVMALIEEDLSRRAGAPTRAADAGPADIEDAYEEVVRPVVRHFTVSRRDAERLRQDLLMLPKLGAGRSAKKERVALLGRRPNFHEAIAMLHACASVHPELEEAAREWREAATHVEAVEEDRPRPRRRGRRRSQERF